MGRSLSYRDLSLWHETALDDWTPRASLFGPDKVDVAIVGAGFTGLWTAYYLLREDPSLRVAVLEAETVGFGASGRNGGWCSASFPASLEKLAVLPGSSPESAKAQHHAMRATVDEVGDVVRSESIDAHFRKAGTIAFARSEAQWRKARSKVADARASGRGEDDIRLLDAEQARRVARATNVRGATYTPDCAVIHPARLARGLARTVELRGARIYERTRVHAIEPHRVRTCSGTVDADVVVRATEGYTPTLDGHTRAIAPVYSLVIATEPLPEASWEEIGLAGRETFTDYRNLIIYGQRSADGRLVFGGRGAPYHFGSSVRPEFDRDDRVFASLRRTLVDLFPVVADARVTHAWGGCLGIPRDWCASVGLDHRSGVAWAGGYVGQGVGTANLAGRTLRDLILGHDTELTALPWVNHRSPVWEPEPLRWLGVNAGLRAMTVADQEERLTRRPSRIAAAASPLIGGH